MVKYYSSELNILDDNNNLVLSLLLNQMIISLTCHERTSKQEIVPLDPPKVPFVPQMLPIALQDKTLLESGNQDWISSKIDTTDDITLIEQKILKLNARYKQMR